MAAEGDIKEVEVAKPEDFDAALEAAVGADRLFAFFKGAIVPDTGEPWCSDTRRLEPAFRAALEGKGATTLLVCPCEEATWTAPDKSHPYRQHALLKCTGAPCLLRFSSDGKTVIGRATEDEISDAEIIKFID